MMPSVSPFFKFSNSYSNSERILVLDCTKGNFQYSIGFYAEDDTQYKLQRVIKFNESGQDTFEQSVRVNYARLVKDCKELGIEISEQNDRNRHSELFTIFSDPINLAKFRTTDTFSSTVHLFDEYTTYTLKVSSLVT